MMLVDVIHQAVTDATFANQIEQMPQSALVFTDTPPDAHMTAALQVVFHGSKSWKELCSPSKTVSSVDWFDPPLDNPVRMDSLQTATTNAPSYYDALVSATAPRQARSQPKAARAPSPRSLPTLSSMAAGGGALPEAGVSNAWNLLYTALHMLDSIEDGDIPDRSWASWGTAPAINLTTGILMAVNMALDALEDTNISAAAARQIRQTFSQTVLTMCAGQHNDLTLLEPTLDQCWAIAEAKSGAFFALACYAGARAATDDPRTIESLRQLGHDIGVLIQIGDDIGGLWSSPSSHSDLVSGQRWTLPVAYTMMQASPAIRERLRACLEAAATDPGAEDEARRLIIESGALLYLAVEAQRLAHRARVTLMEAVVSSSARDALLALIRYATPLAPAEPSSAANLAMTI